MTRGDTPIDRVRADHQAVVHLLEQLQIPRFDRQNLVEQLAAVLHAHLQAEAGLAAELARVTDAELGGPAESGGSVERLLMRLVGTPTDGPAFDRAREQLAEEVDAHNRQTERDLAAAAEGLGADWLSWLGASYERRREHELRHPRHMTAAEDTTIPAMTDWAAREPPPHALARERVQQALDRGRRTHTPPTRD